MAGPIIEPAIKKTFTFFYIFFWLGLVGIINETVFVLDTLFEPEKTHFWVAIHLYAPWRFDLYTVSVHPVIWLDRQSSTFGGWERPTGARCVRWPLQRPSNRRRDYYDGNYRMCSYGWTYSKLQRVQNCLARVVLRAPCFSPSLPLLKQLHWLPVNYRIKCKLSTLTYRALAIHQPPYLASLLHFSNVPRQLRSSTSQQLSIPRTKLNLGKRAFSVAAPIIWNELPTTLKFCESLASFRKNLKNYLFKIAFPP